MFQFILIPLFAWAAKQDIDKGRVNDWLCFLTFFLSLGLYTFLLVSFCNSATDICSFGAHWPIMDYSYYAILIFIICAIPEVFKQLGSADKFFLSSLVFLFGPEVLWSVAFATILYVAIAYLFNLQKEGEKLHAIPIFMIAYLMQAASFFVAFFWH